MTEDALQVWDGVRSPLQRDVVSRCQVKMGRLGIVTAIERLDRPTDWLFEEPDHKIVVHIDGVLDRLECEFSRGPSGRGLPNRGDIWIIPAGCRYAALAQGGWARYVELTVPTSVLGDAYLSARTGFRDDLLAASAIRLSELVTQPEDDLAVMASHAIAHSVELHLMERFGVNRSRRDARSLTAADKLLLIATIRDRPEGPHSLAALAAAVHMSVRQFTTSFQAAFGETPWQFVMRSRLEHAAGLLRRTDRSVTDVALAVGFATPSHFSTAFSRCFGASPSHYRRHF